MIPPELWSPVDQARDMIIEFLSLNLNLENPFFLFFFLFFFPPITISIDKLVLEAQFYFKHQFIYELI